MKLHIRKQKLNSETKVKFGNESQIRKQKLNSETKQLFTCMNLCSGGATVSLVAEVTGLTGYRYTKGLRSQGLRARSENDI